MTRLAMTIAVLFALRVPVRADPVETVKEGAKTGANTAVEGAKTGGKTAVAAARQVGNTVGGFLKGRRKLPCRARVLAIEVLE